MSETLVDDAALERDDEEQFVEFLVAHEKVARAEMLRVRNIQAETKEPLSGILTSLGILSEKELAHAFAECFGLEVIEAEDFPEEPLFGADISAKFLRQSKLLPLAEEEDTLYIAMANPIDRFAVKSMGFLSGRAITRCVATAGEIDSAIERLYAGADTALQGLFEEIDAASGGDVNADVDRIRDLASEAPIVRLVNLLITRAVEARASDIHIEPMEDRVRVRYRIDGVLRDVDGPPKAAAAAVISRIKIMAQLNIAERRLPQDGRIRLAVRGRIIDIRVSTTPTNYGESVVLRLLDQSAVRLDFHELGFTDEQLDHYLQLLRQPYGILLVTGPTGSGKTTTLYTSLNELNEPGRKILTIEDPIEYLIDGINQSQVQPAIGLTFATALRSFLRQDPDIMMVGEIRDLETAETAVQAALTGHLILSTLHTNDAASAITRLIDMGVEDFLITSTLNGVQAQRLVRRLCPECREPFHPDSATLEKWGLHKLAELGEITLYRPVGCEACGHTGFLGRIAILEVLAMTEALRALVMDHATTSAIKNQAIAEGMRTMYEDGLMKALAGATTPEEVIRATREH